MSALPAETVARIAAMSLEDKLTLAETMAPFAPALSAAILAFAVADLQLDMARTAARLESWMEVNQI